MHRQDRRGIAAFFIVAFFCACLTAAVPGISRAEDASEDFSVKMRCRGPETFTLHMRFVGSNPNPERLQLIERTGPFNPAFGNCAGNDPLRWRAGTPGSRRVVYKDVYPGIDLVSYADQGKLQYDLVVGPWADIGKVQIVYEGIRSYVIRGAFPGYQVVGGIRNPIPVSVQKKGTYYELVADHYDRTIELVIPTTSVPLSTDSPVVARLD